jgi:hypothetical protein
MLWYKGWLETRFKLSILAVITLFLLALTYSIGTKAPPPGAKGPVWGIALFSSPAAVIMMCTWLAGAGIATQPSFQAIKGLHGSTIFTLSLPVSRFRLLAVRAGFGWLGMAGAIAVLCLGLWLLFPALKVPVNAFEMFEYAATLAACASAVYFLSVLLATFLDDQWRMWGTMIAAGMLWWLPSHTPLPASVDIFRAMGEGSPLIAHTMPWTAMAFSLGLSAILFFAALRIAQAREY